MYINVLLVVFTSHLFVVIIAIGTRQSRSLSSSATPQGIPQQMDTSPMVCTLEMSVSRCCVL